VRTRNFALRLFDGVEFHLCAHLEQVRQHYPPGWRNSAIDALTLNAPHVNSPTYHEGQRTQYFSWRVSRHPHARVPNVA